jgi:hypothetical protein
MGDPPRHEMARGGRTDRPIGEEGSEHDTIVVMIQKCGDFGVTPMTAADLISEHWIGVKSNRATLEEVEKIAASITKRQKDFGCDHGVEPMTAEECFELITQADMLLDAFMQARAEGEPWKDVDDFGKVWKLRQESCREKAMARVPGGNPDGRIGAAEAKRFSIESWAVTDLTTIPPREWLYGKYLIRKFVSVTAAPGGSGKTSLSLVEGIAMATGLPLLGVKPFKRLNVAFWNEDPRDELRLRVAAIIKHYGIDQSDLVGRLFLASSRDVPMKIASMDNGNVKIMRPMVGEVLEFLISNRIDVFDIDPFINCHGVPENANEAIDEVVKEWGDIAGKANCAISLKGHTRKPANGVARENATADARGAGSYIDAARVARALTVMSEKEADNLGVQRGKRKLFFRVTDGKENMSRPADTETWFEMKPVLLDNATGERPAEEVGVATLSGINLGKDEILGWQVAAIQSVIAVGVYRASPQAKENWAGLAVAEALDLDLGDPAELTRVKALLKKMLEKGFLEKGSVKDGDHKPRPGIVVGSAFEEADAAPPSATPPPSAT